MRNASAKGSSCLPVMWTSGSTTAPMVEWSTQAHTATRPEEDDRYTPHRTNPPSRPAGAALMALMLQVLMRSAIARVGEDNATAMRGLLAAVVPMKVNHRPCARLRYIANFAFGKAIASTLRGGSDLCVLLRMPDSTAVSPCPVCRTYPSTERGRVSVREPSEVFAPVHPASAAKAVAIRVAPRMATTRRQERC